MSLEQAIALAQAQHPDAQLRKARSTETIALKESSPNLPPLTLFGSVMGSNGPINSNGRMENSFGLSQTIPFPSKLSSESKVRKLEADSANVAISAEELRIEAQVKADFFNLFAAREKQVLLNQKAMIFEEHNRRVRATTLTDRIMQAHRIGIQTELDLVQNEIIVAQEEEKIAAGRFNLSMGIDPSTSVPKLLVPAISPLPNFELKFSDSHPQLNALELSQSAAQASVAQAKTLWLPDLSFTYRNARRFDGVMPNYSELTMGITLPFLFFWQASGQVSAASARAQMAGAQIQKVRNELSLELLEAKARVASTHAQLLNFENRIIPQAEKRMRIAQGLVPSDMESLNEHRDAMDGVISLKLAALKSRVDYEKALALMDSLQTNKIKDSKQ